jgi:glycine hydroxymethyltransferase
VPYADITTTTTHKTLRGPRGGLVLTNDEALAKKINSNVFPGIQGGPLEHVIAGKAISFKEALDPSFKDYASQVIKNAKAMAEVFNDSAKARLISGSTDNHLLLIDVTGFDMTGKDAEKLLDTVNITVNKNSIPFETLSPFKTSGIRVGTPAITSRGFDEEGSAAVAKLIVKVLENKDDESVHAQVKEEVRALTDAHPLYAK